MIFRHCAIFFACWFAADAAVAQTSPSPAFDERTARVVERYKEMLGANPVEGLALDRLWKAFEEKNATGALVEEYRRAAEDAKQPGASLVYGHLLQRAGRPDDASKAFARAAQLDPTSALPLLAQADLARARGDFAAAAGSYEQALNRLDPKDRQRADILLKLGESWQSAGQPAKAAEAWENLVAASPEDWNLRQRLADNYERHGLPDRAVTQEEYIAAHAEPARSAQAWRELGRLQDSRGNFDAARDALEHGIALLSRDNWMYAEMQGAIIRLYERAGRSDELKTRWEQAVAQSPRDLGGYLRLIALAQAQGDAAAEKAAVEKAAALSPHDRDLNLKLARLCADSGDRDRASQIYDGLLKNQPGNLDLILARAELDVQAGDPQAAAARVEARLAQNPADESVSTPALQFFLTNHLNAAAEKCLRAAQVRTPEAPDPLLALVKFLFQQRKSAEAQQALEAFGKLPGDSAARSKRWMAIADAYKEAHQDDDALRGWQQAYAAQPAPAPLLASGDLLTARGDSNAAADRYELALTVATDDKQAVEIDQKLFDALANGSKGNPSSPSRVSIPGLTSAPLGSFAGTTGRVTLRMGTFRGGGGIVTLPENNNPRLAAYLTNLENAARDKPTAENYLRLARWRAWSHRPEDARFAAEKAINIDPQNIPARDLLVSIAAERHDRIGEEKTLHEIGQLDPTRNADCLKQIADLQLAGGDADRALAILQGLQKQEPGSANALADLALGQQRADRWFDALATWEQAYALPKLSPEQRSNLRRPLLAAYEHLGEFQRAAELLAGAVDAQNDLPARQDLFRELATFCGEHALLPWLRERYEARLHDQPQDYFTMMAVAEMRQVEGRDQEAYDLRKKAFYSAPDRAAALRTLINNAETMGNEDEAIAQQKRLVALPNQATAENLQKLATLEDAALDETAAKQTWNQLVAKFPRDTSVLSTAATAFETNSEVGRARELLGQCVALDPSDLGRCNHLAMLDASAGDMAGARACLEQILARTTPETPGEPWRVPTELDIRANPVAFAATAGAEALDRPAGSAELDDKNLRLAAIREMSRLLFPDGKDAGAGRAWLDRWNAAAAAGARSEPLAALFYAGQSQRVMDLTRSWVGTGPATDTDQQSTFLLAGFRLEKYDEVAQWVWNTSDTKTAERTEVFGETLDHFLATGGHPGPDMVGKLFPASLQRRDILWQAALVLFAEKRWYPQAVELGERALKLPGGNQAADAFQVAQWELDVGRLDAARQVLRQALDDHTDAAAGATLTDAIFADLRAYYWLIPPAERASFSAEYLARLGESKANPARTVLAGTILNGLAGNESEAFHEVDRLIEMRLLDSHQTGSPDARRWSYLATNGNQLEAWHLPALAAHLLRRALFEVSAFEQRDPQLHAQINEMRIRLLRLDVMTAANPQDARERVQTFLREQPAAQLVASAAAALMNSARQPSAAILYEYLCRAEPADPQYPRDLLSAQEASSDVTGAEKTMSALLDGGLPLDRGQPRTDLICRLASLRQTNGDAAGARQLLQHACAQFPQDVAIREALAESLEVAGNFTDAMAVWQEAGKLDAQPGAILARANLEVRAKNVAGAVDLLRGAMNEGPENTRVMFYTQLVSICLANDRIPEALDLIRTWTGPGKAMALAEVVPLLTEHGQRDFAREMLTAAVRSEREPIARYRLQAALIRLDGKTGGANLPRQLQQLKRLAGATAESRAEALDVSAELSDVAGADKWLVDDLARRWNKGQGDINAALSLAGLYISQHQEGPLRELVMSVDARVNLPEQTLATLEMNLLASDQYALAGPLSDRLLARFPRNGSYVLSRARILWKTGQQDAANQLLAVTEAADATRDDFSGRVGQFYLEMGDRSRATASLESVIARDPLALRTGDLHFHLAALYQEAGRMADAKRTLIAAYRNPTEPNLDPLVDFLDASGELKEGALGMPGADFPLSYAGRAQLLADIYLRCQESGRQQVGRNFVYRHPELLAGNPAFAARLCTEATPETLVDLSKVLESAIAQSDPVPAGLKNDLAQIELRQATESLHAPMPQKEDALQFLTKANALAPNDFPIASQLAEMCAERKQSARAAEIFKPFLSPDALPSERAQAQAFLDRMK